MRKLLMGIVLLAILIVAVALLLPFSLGVLVKNNSGQILQSIFLKHGTVVKVLDYKRGWFRSSAKIDFTILGLKDASGKALNIIMQEDLQHGPFIKTATGWKFAKAVIKFKSLSAQYPMLIDTSLAFNGDLVGDLSVPSWEMIAKDNKSEKLTDLHTQFSSNIYSGDTYARPRVSQLQVVIPALGNKIAPMLVQLNNMQLSSTFNWRKPWDSVEADAKVDSVRGVSKQETTLANNIYAKTVVTAYNKLVSIALNLSIASLKTPAANFSDIAVDAKVSGLSQARLRKIISIMHKLRLSSPDERQALLPQLNKALMAALTNSLDLNLKNFALTTPQGPLKLALHVKLPQQNTEKPSYFVILAGMQTSLDLQITRPWLQMILENWPVTSKKPKLISKEKTKAVNAQIDGLIKHGQLVADGDNLQLHIKYSDGQLMVNGNPFMMFGSGLTGGATKPYLSTPNK